MTDTTNTEAALIGREVRTGSRDGRSTKIAVARRTYPADRQDLWDALTNPERIPRWFLPVEGDLRVGGRYQLIGNAGGVVERCDRPSSFAATWEMGDMVSWLEVTLTPADEGTTLELVHEAFVDPDLWGQFGPSAVGIGWDLGLLGLGMHLASGESVDPDLAANFLTWPEGIAFARASASGWADAAAADGDDPLQAREAAERTVAAYTAVPETESEPESQPESVSEPQSRHDDAAGS
ncbi:SRPBCC domain-containing protein [Planctomonas deserti]|uniref:SRPBCC domain-containing protein n=1 Tax=Planctomonas deserti TaxID=2144185 RepID=UPI000D36DE01|nr:SRPBCC domain-containing protein [Planctomonas deserti]